MPVLRDRARRAEILDEVYEIEQTQCKACPFNDQNAKNHKARSEQCLKICPIGARLRKYGNELGWDDDKRGKKRRAQ